MRLETAVSPLPAGAGRLVDVIWPDPGDATATARTRLLGQSFPASQTQASGGVIGLIRDATYEMDYVTLTTTITAGSQASVSLGASSMIVHFCTKTNGGVPAQVNDALVTRVYATMFMPGGVGPINDNLHDFGFQMTVLGASQLLAGNQWGFGFQLADSHTVQFVARDAIGLSVTNLTAAPFDVTVPHTYEMRITSATNTTPATLAALIDNVPYALPVSLSSWNAATRRLPPNINGSGSGSLGWAAGVINRGGQVCTLGVSQVRIISAPSVQACL